MIEQYQKNKVIILAIIIFIIISVPTIYYYYYSSKKSDLENCADELIKDYMETLKDLKLNSEASFYEKLLNKSVKKKMEYRGYGSRVEVCEKTKIKSPESFKLKYGN
jgi:hypothetical protein